MFFYEQISGIFLLFDKLIRNPYLELSETIPKFLYNENNLNEFMSNKIKCSHILVEKQSEALAILERIKKGEKFGKLAKELSIDSGSAKRDGSLGYFGRGMMVKPFEEAAFKLQVGELSEPVKSEFGYHLIKRLG